MSEQHRIETIAQLVDLVSVENVDTLAADLKTFLRIHAAHKAGLMPGVSGVGHVFCWNDDNQPGVSAIRLHPAAKEASDAE